MSYHAPSLSSELLCARANEFTQRYNPQRETPVPIEAIIELQFGLDIVPIPGLRDHFDVAAYITSDLREIRIDQDIYEHNTRGTRLCLTHELGHFILHQDLFLGHTFSTIAEFKAAVTGIGEKEYRLVEHQADTFAGIVLVPAPELAQAFESYLKRMNDAGLTTAALGQEGVRESLETYVSRDFDVPPWVIHRRLEQEKLWEAAMLKTGRAE